MLQCHDLFVTDMHQYPNGFRGPGKYDGSVVNWVNGRLLAAIGVAARLRRQLCAVRPPHGRQRADDDRARAD